MRFIWALLRLYVVCFLHLLAASTLSSGRRKIESAVPSSLRLSPIGMCTNWLQERAFSSREYFPLSEKYHREIF